MLGLPKRPSLRKRLQKDLPMPMQTLLHVYVPVRESGDLATLISVGPLVVPLCQPLKEDGGLQNFVVTPGPRNKLNSVRETVTAETARNGDRR